MTDEPNAETFGTLYVVATPIGNLEDLSPRALCTLKAVDVVLAEDTRSFGILKSRFGIETPATSYHDHNERERIEWVLSELQLGKSLALISEAGTPTISDPGYRVVRACRENSIRVVTIPGPSAVIAALSVSGLETDSFFFRGFLPQKPGKRLSALTEAVQADFTTIFYESPFRIVKSLEALVEINPEARVFIGRELTKLYEESFYGSAHKVLEQLKIKGSIKGEFVLIIGKTL